VIATWAVDKNILLWSRC